MIKTIIPIALLILFLTGCGQEIQPGNTQAETQIVKGLTLLTLSAGQLAAGETFVGSVEAPDRGLVAARIDGRVGRIAVKEGERVKAGALLLTLLETTAGDQSRAAAAGVAEAQGALAAAKARLELADKTLARYRQLFAKEAVTPLEMDRVSAEQAMAANGLAAAEAAVQRLSAQRAAAATAAGYTQVSAPYDAVVVRKEVQEGSTVLPGMPLLTLDRQGALRVRAQLPEGLTGQVAVGDPFSVELPALGKSLAATVAEVLPAADPRSRAFEIKLDLAEQAGLSAGLFARVAASSSQKSALLIPAGAILERGQLNGVFVVKEEILHYRLVKTGVRVGDQVEILSGLSVGETLVTGGLEQAVSGARVGG